ncbi:hypothetical protein NFI96_003429 [Prochilodus magdalenae]|nr:hypothetical protein NFI96_003429 [Prochilodus magdalenae]
MQEDTGAGGDTVCPAYRPVSLSVYLSLSRPPGSRVSLGVLSLWSQQPGYEGGQSPVLHERSSETQAMLADGDGLREREREPTLERARSAAPITRLQQNRRAVTGDTGAERLFLCCTDGSRQLVFRFAGELCPGSAEGSQVRCWTRCLDLGSVVLTVLFHALPPLEAKWHMPSTKILNSLKERGKDSPNRLARQGGDKNSSHSSSNTLSSSASSSNSDEKHFGSGDLMDPELLGLTYIKGASTDSGIDTAPCCAPPQAPGVAATSVARIVLQGRGPVEQGHAWAPEHPENSGADEEHSKLYLPQSYAAALAVGHTATDGSVGDLSEISSHSRCVCVGAVQSDVSCAVQSDVSSDVSVDEGFGSVELNVSCSGRRLAGRAEVTSLSSLK